MNKILNNNIQTKEKYLSSKSLSRFFLQKLTKGIIIPIILLSFAGLLFGLGTEITNILDEIWNTEDQQILHKSAYIFPIILESIGEIIFSNLGLFFAIAIAITFTDDAGIAGFSAFVGWIIFNAFQIPFISGDLGSSFNILFYQDIPSGILTTNMGVITLNTSLFGGVIVGFTVAWIYNKFHAFKLPTILSFFSGTRLVPIMTFLLMPILAMYFLLIYPLFGIGLNHLSNLIINIPNQGISSFIFGTIEKVIMPFGLQDAFTSPLVYIPNQIDVSFYISFIEESKTFYLQDNFGSGFGNLFIFNEEIYSYLSNSFIVTSGEENLANYIQTNYPITLFALPAAGIAIILATKNINQRIMFSTLTLTIITTFLTGISEPLEFFILFWTPLLYFGFHIWMAGFSVLFMNFLGSNLEMSFYGGLIDFILSGIQGVTIWPILLFGIFYFLIYFSIFYLYIWKFNPQLVNESTSTIYLIEQNILNIKKLKAKGIDPETGIDLERSKKVQEILQNLGGFKNLITIDACFTRLRITVHNKNNINQENLKKLGALAITTVGDHGVQIIFGKEADQIKDDLLTYNKHIQKLFEFKESLKKNK